MSSANSSVKTDGRRRPQKPRAYKLLDESEVELNKVDMLSLAARSFDLLQCKGLMQSKIRAFDSDVEGLLSILTTELEQGSSDGQNADSIRKEILSIKKRKIQGHLQYCYLNMRCFARRVALEKQTGRKSKDSTLYRKTDRTGQIREEKVDREHKKFFRLATEYLQIILEEHTGKMGSDLASSLESLIAIKGMSEDNKRAALAGESNYKEELLELLRNEPLMAALEPVSDYDAMLEEAVVELEAEGFILNDATSEEE